MCRNRKGIQTGQRFLPQKRKEWISSTGREWGGVGWGIATLEARVLENRNCFWDRYWGRAGKLLANFSPFLVTVPNVFAEGNSSWFPSLLGDILHMITSSGRELLERNGQCFYLRRDGLECIHG